MSDIQEKLFGKFYLYLKSKKKQKKEDSKYSVRLEDFRRRFEILLNLLLEKKIMIKISDDEGYFNGNTLYLPHEINLFQNEKLNLDIYLHRVISLDPSFDLKIHFKELYEEISKLNIDYSKILFGKESTIEEEPKESKLNILENEKRDKKSSLKIKASFNPKKITLNQTAENPITHNLEKVKTAEEFQGGNRSTDGSDEIDEHKDALDELKLTHIIRTNETTEGYLEADIEVEGTPIEEEDIDSMEGKTFKYDEWSAKKNIYLKDWCILYESKAELTDIAPSPSKDSVLKNTIFFLANEPEVLKKQKSGHEIDVEAYVRYIAAPRESRSAEPQIYLSKKKLHSSVSIEILIDQSLSTESFIGQEKILDIIKSEVDDFSSALYESNLEFKIASFYTHTRKNCYYKIIKDFKEEWGKKARNKLYSLRPSGYTRIGPPLRHSIKSLKDRKTKKKIILLFSDAKPTDYDAYEGSHGISDVSKAVLEAKSQDIHVHCMAFHHNRNIYLKRIFGQNHYDQINSSKEFLNAFINLTRKLL